MHLVFIFFAEAIISYLRSHVPHIAGLQLPLIENADEELLDKENVDDIALYIAFFDKNMETKISFGPLLHS